MAAEYYPASLVNSQVPIGSALTSKGYYRSKLFIAPYSANNLVMAAGPILSLLERLCLTPSLPPIENIRDNIEHELRAFESILLAAKYPTNLMNIGHYLLTATIDELVGKNYLRVHHVPAEFHSFTVLNSDGIEPQQRFFEILHFIKDRPNQYLDLIELVYFCLIIGFEGEHHIRADGRQVLDNHMENLYQIIQQHRFNKPSRLFSENPLPKTIKKNYKATLLSAIIAVSLIAVAFLSSHLLLENKAKNVLFGHNQLAMLDH